MTRLDRLVTFLRGWLEDRLPWYDRAAEQQAEARNQAIHSKSIGIRIESERVRLASYRRIRNLR